MGGMAQSDEATLADEDVEIELTDIASAVSGNDEGSEEEDSGDELEVGDPGDGEMGNNGLQDGNATEPLMKKRHYRKQNRARRNRILIFIVRHALITE